MEGSDRHKGDEVEEEMKDDTEGGRGGEGWMIEEEKKEVITCAGLQPLVSHIKTHTHTHHAALLSTLNNASHRRDGAAAVATRERCGRAETAGRGLRGDWPETDSALMSSLPPSALPCPSIHPLTSLARMPSSVNTVDGRERDRERIACI